MRSHIFLFGSLPRRRPPEFTAILMFEFWREATATSVPGLLCQYGRRRPENVSIFSSLVTQSRRLVQFTVSKWLKLTQFHLFTPLFGEKSNFAMGKPSRSAKNEPLGCKYLHFCVSKLEVFTQWKFLNFDGVLQRTQANSQVCFKWMSKCVI